MKVNGKNNQTMWNTYEFPGEVNDEASMTVPGQSLKVRDIMEKHVRGINLPIGKQPIFNEADIDTVDINKIVDITEAESLHATEVQRLQAKYTKKGALDASASSATEPPA